MLKPTYIIEVQKQPHIYYVKNVILINERSNTQKLYELYESNKQQPHQCCRSKIKIKHIYHTDTTQKTIYYPARARSARARRACALRALGLLLADGAPTVGWGKTFWCVGRFFLQKGPFLGNQKSKNQSEGTKSIVSARSTNGPLTKSRVLQKKQIFGPKFEFLGPKKGLTS